jgi:amino acid adenylation domain-containing protein
MRPGFYQRNQLMSEASRHIANLSVEEKRQLLTRLLKEKGRDRNSFPLSYAQQQVWLLEQFEPGSAAYNITDMLRLIGPLSLPALDQALSEIIRRHEILRTTFQVIDEQAVQVVGPPRPLRLHVTDLGQLDETQCREVVREYAQAEAQYSFDLATGPLLRLRLLRLAQEEHLLLLTMHHIISDGWSINVLLNEISRLYDAFTQGQPSPLAELPVQYADYALWQREWLRGDVLVAQLDYWKRRLKSAPAVLDLPTDHPRPPVQTMRGGRLGMSLPQPLAEQLKTLSRGAGVTLFMTLLAAFKTLLYRYTGQTDIVIGTPVAGRNRPEVEGLIGFFINTLVLRTDLSGNPSFRELMRREREVCLGAYAHQEVPFEKLVEELRPERSLSHTPLVQVLFNMLSFAERGLHLRGLAIEQLAPPETGSKFDITFYVKEQAAGIHLTLVYSRDLFAEARMRELLDQFKHLLAQILESPDESINHFSLVTQGAASLLPDPARRLPSDWKGASQALFSQRARLLPHHPALLDQGESWTYKELEERSNQLANYLLLKGVQRGEAVAIYAHRSAALVWAILGVLKSGAAFVILDPAYPERRLMDYLRAARPRAWLHIAAAGEMPSALESFVAGLPFRCRLKLDSRTETETQTFSKGLEMVPPAQALYPSQDALQNCAVANPCVAVKPYDTAYVAFTSGSTGKPKGVLGTQESLTHYHSWVSETFGINEGDRFSMLSGLSHDPLLRDIFTPLQLGAALCIPGPELMGVPGRLVQWMRESEITVTNLTPALGQLLFETAPDDAGPELSHLRYSFFVGEALTVHDVSRLRKSAPFATCVNLYGATETQRALGYYIVPKEREMVEEERAGVAVAAKEVLPVGKGIEGVQLLVLNATQRLTGVGELGEIYFRSPHLAQGYLHEEALTRERFLTNPLTGIAADRLYQTGDVGRYLPDGNLELKGRADYQVKVRGFRVELGEVETALREETGVSECVVLLREDAPGDRRLVAYLSPQSETSQHPGELRLRLRKRLPDYMIPAAFVFLETMPLTPNGKVDRRALPLPSEMSQPTNVDYLAPQTHVEETLAEIWRQVLKLDRVDLRDDFFEAGGHSLLAMKVLFRVRELMQVELSLRSIFEAPTLGQFAARVEAAMRGEADPSATPIRRVPLDEEPLMSFAQEGWLLREWWEHVHLIRRKPFHLVATFRLHGPLDLRILERALNEVVRRHDALRTTFPAAKGIHSQKKLYPFFRKVLSLKLVQNRLYYRPNSQATVRLKPPKFFGGPRLFIRPHMKLELPLVDLQHLSETERGAEIERLLCEEMYTPFEYENGPMLRVVVIRSAAAEHIVNVVLHHLIADGLSKQIFITEMLTLYRSMQEGRPSPLPELPIQYTDFARWQREWFQGENLRAMLAYWKEQFAGVGLFPELTLPFTRSEPPDPDFHKTVEVQNLIITPSLSASLKEFGHQHGVTYYMLFMAALKTLLHRYTGRPKISIFAPFANRSRAETQRMIGWLANIHVLSTDCSGNPLFSELLKRVREVVLGAYAHQEIPYLLLVKSLLPERRDYEMPQRIFEVPYIFYDFVIQPESTQQIADLVVGAFPGPPGSADAGLEVKVVERGEELSVSIRYSPDRVAAVNISRMLTEFEKLLQGIIAAPAARLQDLPVAVTN